jgi:hypothetical protein
MHETISKSNIVGPLRTLEIRLHMGCEVISKAADQSILPLLGVLHRMCWVHQL